MEFWGVEVKAGETIKVPRESEACIHLSQAALGEAKKDKASEPVILYLKFGDQKLVLGTLNRGNIPQIPFDIVLQDEFELSHTSKNASVYFCGYKALGGEDEDEDEDDITHSDDFSDSEDEPYDISLMKEFDGNFKKKPEDTKAAEPNKLTELKKAVGKGSASEKQVKVVEPQNDEEDSDDFDGDENELGSSDDEMDADSDSDSDEDEETPPKKADLSKKRAHGSASKSPVSSKKAKNATPHKTDGKKSGHVATPHPMKKGGKTQNNEAEDQTPKSGGQFSCNSCKKTFNSEGGLQQHNKAKHQ